MWTSLNASNWTVRLDAEGKSESGRAVRSLIEGKLENAEALEAARFSSARTFKSTVRLRRGFGGNAPQRGGDTRAPEHPCTFDSALSRLPL